MRILIACEFSGVVRRAFRDAGHDAWSCDLLPAEDGAKEHYQCSVKTVLGFNWGMLIGHPPCTFLCNSGVRWLAPGGKLNAARHKQMMEAADFFAALYHADIPLVGIENPVMHGYARDYLQSAWKVPSYSFSLQPWQHGEPEVKRTCFWLRGLEPLQPSNIVTGRRPRVHHASPGPDRWKERSRTLPGIAKAMAEQWGKLCR